MVEWSITPVLKTGERRRSGGSNPSLSAEDRRDTQKKRVMPVVFSKNKEMVRSVKIAVDRKK